MSARMTSAFQIYHKLLWYIPALRTLGEWLFVLFRPRSKHCRSHGHSILTEFRSPFAFR